MIKSFVFLVIFIFLNLIPVTLFGQSLRCDRQNQFCLVDNRRLILGDKMGIFNEYNELVAVGEVDEMKGSQRRITLKKVYGLITRDSKAVIIEDSQAQNPEASFRVVRPPVKNFAGGSVGLGHLNIGAGGMTLDFEGFYEILSDYGFKFVGRGALLYSSGKVTDVLDDSNE